MLSVLVLPVVALLATVTSASAAGAGGSLHVGVSQAWAMPFANIENERLSAGILHDLYAEIGKELQMPVVHIVAPRKRVEQLELQGLIDLSCYANPAWTAKPEAFVWSAPLFTIYDVVFGVRTTGVPRRLDDLAPQAVVSTVLGYHYPALDARFANASLKREDTVDQYRVFLKLSAGRTPYGTANALSLAWYRRMTPNHGLADWQLEIARNDFHCSVPHRGVLPSQTAFAAIERLRKSGRIEAILKNYR